MAERKMWIDRSTLEGIADAIRSKKGTTDPIPVTELKDEILSIAGGGEIVEVIPEGYVDTSDATATADKIFKGKTAYVKGEKITGTYVEKSGGTTEVIPDGYVNPSDATVTASDVIKGKTFYGADGKKTGTMPSVTENTPTLTLESDGNGNVTIKHTQMFNTYLPAGETVIGTVAYVGEGDTDSALPIEVATEMEMSALLSSGEVGGVYKYVGETGTYENGALYVLEVDI